MAELFRDYYEHIVRKKSYWLPLLIFSVSAYAFDMLHRTVGIDDLRNVFYYSLDEHGVASGFWSRILVGNLLGFMEFTPLTAKLVALMAHLLSSMVLGAMFYFLNGRKKSVMLYSALASVLVTYPLINEIWDYHIGNAFTTIFNLVIYLLILFQLTWQKERWKAWLIVAFPLGVQLAGGESSAFLYVATVCMVLFYQYVILEKPNVPKFRWITEGLSFAVPLVLAVMIRFALIFLMLRLFGVEQWEPNGDYGVKWGKSSPLLAVLYLAVRYILAGLLYFPIGVFVIAALVFCVVCVVYCFRRRSGLPVLLGLCVICGVFTQFFIQGQYPGYRHASPHGAFVAFVAYLILELSMDLRRQSIQRWVAAGLLFLAWHQSVFMNEIFALNNQRSDNELAIVRQIGFRLEELHTEKPVAFVGNPDVIGDYIYSRVSVDQDTLGGKLFLQIFDTGKHLFHMEDSQHPLFTGTEHFKYVHTNVDSVLVWATGENGMMKELFAYCGYDFEVVSQEETQRMLWDTAKEMGLQTFDILETSDYVIVCLGDLSTYGVESTQVRN